MDEAKRQKQDDLNKQIDPEVHERVAQVTGDGGDEATSPVPPTQPGTAPSRSTKSSEPQVGGLGDLKEKTAKLEQDLNLAPDQDTAGSATTESVSTKPENKKNNKAFVIFDVNMLRGRQILTYFQRMNFYNSTMVGDPNGFIESLMNWLNDAQIVYPAAVTHVDVLPVVKAILSSDEIRTIMKQIRDCDTIPQFVLYENDRDLAKVHDVDPRYLLSQRHNPSFSRKRVEQVLEVLHKPDSSIDEPDS